MWLAGVSREADRQDEFADQRAKGRPPRGPTGAGGHLKEKTPGWERQRSQAA